MNDSLISKVLGASNYFERLLLPEITTDIENVKKAYRKLALRIHPDKCKDPKSDEAFKSLTEAYECLVNSSSQSNYLHQLRSKTRTSSQQPPSATRRRKNREEDLWEKMSKKRSKPTTKPTNTEPKKPKQRNYYAYKYQSEEIPKEKEEEEQTEPIPCPGCKRKFTTQELLERHLRFADLNHQFPFNPKPNEKEMFTDVKINV